MPTVANLDAVLAAIQLDPDRRPAVASPLEWYRCADGGWTAVPAEDASYEWQHDLWWPGHGGGRLLTALHRIDERALTRL